MLSPASLTYQAERRRPIRLRTRHNRANRPGEESHLYLTPTPVFRRRFTRSLRIFSCHFPAIQIKMLECERHYMCTRCQHVFKVFSAADQRNVFELPLQCPSRQSKSRQGFAGPPAQVVDDADMAGYALGLVGPPAGGGKQEKEKVCRGSTFEFIEGSSVCRDYQEVKLQEKTREIGRVPRTVIVILTDDLVDTCQAGDDATVSGVVGHLWSSFTREQRCDIDLVLHANNVE